MTNNLTIIDLKNDKSERQQFNLEISIKKTEIESVGDINPPSFLIYFAAMIRKADSQDEHIRFLKKRFKTDAKEFGYKGCCLLLIKNIFVENWSLFVMVKDRFWKWMKWLTSLSSRLCNCLFYI